MTSARQIYLGSRRGPALPYDAEVEYIESTGTQWIDTGILFGQHSKLILQAQFTSFTSYGMGSIEQIGTNYRRLHFLERTGNVGQIWATLGNAATYEFPVPAGFNTYLIDVPRGIVGFNDSRSSFSLNYQSTGISIYLFARNGVPASLKQFLSMRIRRFIVDENDITVRDFISVRIGTEGAMYDRVSGQLFRNSGTGSFRFGTDIAGGV